MSWLLVATNKPSQLRMRQDNEHSRYYAEASNKRLVSVAMRLDNTARKKRRSGGDTVLDLTGPGIEPQTSRTDSDVLSN